ncbi:MAG: GntR family transcriptional regulator [Burkholderiales bacterium]|nr:GntR family transcriptional regulator [Burkholderiales bacterium]
METREDSLATAAPSLSASAYQFLLARLRGGHLDTGERLVEADIATRLGVSRVPVRQALLQLVAEGYLVSTPRGYRMPTLGPEDIQDVFELRLLLEPRAAALAARDITPEQIRELDIAIGEAQAAHKSNDVPAAFGAGRRFRDAWLGAVRNSRLASSITRYNDQVILVRQMTLADFERRQRIVSGYEDLRHAFAHHDSVTAHDCMQSLVLAAQRDFTEVTSLPQLQTGKTP